MVIDSFLGDFWNCAKTKLTHLFNCAQEWECLSTAVDGTACEDASFSPTWCNLDQTGCNHRVILLLILEVHTSCLCFNLSLS